MKQFRIMTLCCLILLLTVSVIPFRSTLSPVAAQEGGSAVFEPAACMFEVPDGVVEGQDVECGYLTVPEFHAQPDGNTIRLAVVIIRSTSGSTETPLVMAQGGPGGSTIDLFAELMLGNFGAGVLAQRDVILFDQRGTLYSEPFLGCSEIYQATLDTLDDVLTDEEEVALYIQTSEACRERLVAEGVNLSAFNSVENAADVAALAATLGYDQINFYGVSYGTLLGFHLMRDHGDILRSVVLDAVVPTQINFIPNVAITADRSFDLLFETCANDPACATDFPDLEATFYALVDELDANPQPFTLKDDETGDTYDAILTGEAFIDAVFGFMYQTQFIPQMPRLIYEVKNGDYQRFSAWLAFFVFDDTNSDGMYASVLCAEDGDFTVSDFDVTGVEPVLAEAMISPEFLDICALWDVTVLDSYVDVPVNSDVPVLLMSGDFDPITPPSYADAAAETLPNSYNLVFPLGGHGAFFETCGMQIALEFLNNPSAQPDTTCIDNDSAVGVQFAPPSAGRYTDPAGRFSFEIPTGWANIDATGELPYAFYLEGETRSEIYAAAVEAADVDAGIAALNELFFPGLTLEAVDQTDVEDWSVVFYINGQNIYIVVAQAKDGVAYGFALKSDLATFEDVIGALDEILISFTIN